MAAGGLPVHPPINKTLFSPVIHVSKESISSVRYRPKETGEAQRSHIIYTEEQIRT